jgi:hypothetical protein
MTTSAAPSIAAGGRTGVTPLRCRSGVGTWDRARMPPPRGRRVAARNRTRVGTRHRAGVTSAARAGFTGRDRAGMTSPWHGAGVTTGHRARIAARHRAGAPACRTRRRRRQLTSGRQRASRGQRALWARRARRVEPDTRVGVIGRRAGITTRRDGT